MQRQHSTTREPTTHNSITESENLVMILARVYEDAGMPEAAAWEASLADLDPADPGGNEKTGAFSLQMAEPPGNNRFQI